VELQGCDRTKMSADKKKKIKVIDPRQEEAKKFDVSKKLKKALKEILQE
jgi:hypothetical protein